MEFLKDLNKKEINLTILNKVKEYILIFLVGGIVGYIYEMIFYYVTEGVLINRGVLYGPFLPIYAFGAVFLVLFLKRFKKYPWLFFILAMVVTGLLEYFTGLYLDKVSNQMLWDYNGLFLNINGYVCLRSVISFALGGLLLIYVVEPLLRYFIVKKIKAINVIIVIFIIILTIDFIFSKLYRM